MRRFIFLIAFLSLFATQSASAQKKKDKIRYKAEKLTNDKDPERGKFKKLLDRVVFTQNETIVYCDSAYFFNKEQVMEAYGRIRIKDGDSVTITAKKLIYLGLERKALLREDVVYRRGDKRLYTDILDYDMINEIAEFKEDGKLVDQRNTLTGNYGRYVSRAYKAFMYKDVLLVGADFNLRTDTLEYSTITQIAITKGPTYIDNRDGTTVDADGGTFRTAVDQTIFKEGTIETRNYIIVGDDIFIDDLQRYYTATGNVVMTSKKDDIIITGEKAIYDKQDSISHVFGDPLMKRVLENDTLFMSADTLVSIENADVDKERLLAYHNILFYKKDLQGKADSVSYFISDSTMYMYNDPILWNDESQMEADTIRLMFMNKILKEMKLRRNSFLTSLDTLGQHNQIKGRNMTGYFNDTGEITTMDVDGNGESHYFVLEGDSVLLGMNKMFCSNMRLRFANNELQNITFYRNPEAKFIPPHELLRNQVLLDGFDWRMQERPELEDVATYYAKKEDEEIKEKTTDGPLSDALKTLDTTIDVGEIKKAVQPPAQR